MKRQNCNQIEQNLIFDNFPNCSRFTHQKNIKINLALLPPLFYIHLYLSHSHIYKIPLYYSAGNAFIVNIALADLLITSVVMPASTIVLLAGIDNSDTEVCKFQWFLAACSFLVSILTLAVSIGSGDLTMAKTHIKCILCVYVCEV